MTDTELMMLEQMTYINAACDIVDIPASQVTGDTIKDRLLVFDENAIRKLEESGAEGQQWAAIIKYIQGNDEINSLVQAETFKDSNGTVLATSYYHKDDPSSGFVTFNGTTTANNWYDNGTGFGTSDTEVQKEALEYIDSLPFDNIEVVGHSKGGNLAQYVTITSDKITRCVSMDGQGFSQEFLDKYWAEIELRGGCITNYSLSGDFVHILLYPIPNAKQDYCTGDRVDSVVENHYANSFFQYETTFDANGNPVTVLKVDSEGNPYIINNQKENEMMTYLHEFTCFALSTMPADERVEMGDYIGNILKLTFSGEPKEPVVGADGKVYTDVLEYVFSDEEMFCKLIAYVIKYMETYNLTEAEVRQLLSLLGMDSFMQAIDEYYAENKIACDIIIGSAESILMFLLKNITDGKEDKIIEAILRDILPYFLSNAGIEIDYDLASVWQNIEEEYVNIPNVKPGANQNISIRVGRTYKYTDEVYAILQHSIDVLERFAAPNLSAWSKYVEFKWYESLFVHVFIECVDKYNTKVYDLCSDGKRSVLFAFDAVEKIDSDCAQKIYEIVSDINVLVLGTQ